MISEPRVRWGPGTDCRPTGTCRDVVGQALLRNRKLLTESTQFSVSPILPRWLLNQWLTDSLLLGANFHLWKCSARGAKTIPRNDLPGRWLTALPFAQPCCLERLRLCPSLCFDARRIGVPSSRRFHPHLVNISLRRWLSPSKLVNGNAKSATRAGQSSRAAMNS